MFTQRPKSNGTQPAYPGSQFALHADDDLAEPPPPPRDMKKVLLIFGLGALSWVATYVGMLELIQANMGELGLGTKVIIGCSVAMLMTMIIWLLDQMFAPLPFVTKVAYFFGYVFLTMISVGFGFGFYWKVLESRSEASRSAESAVTQVQGSLVAAAARLDQLQTTLADLTTVSEQKAIEERDRGTSCPNSRPGDGPRRRLRDSDAARFSFASNFVSGRLTKIKTELKGLDGALLKISSGDPSTIDPKTGTRNAYLKSLSQKLELTAARFNAFSSDPQLRQIRTELDQRAATTIFPNGRGGTFSCPDPQLQTALRGVVRAIDQLPQLQKPHIATVEGSEAVIEAFRRLGATFQGALLFDLPPSADEMRELQKKAVRKAETSGRPAPVVTTLQGGLSKRDYIPLAIALFVDICLLLVSIGRPMNRMDNLVPRMKMAERGPVYQILSKFSDIHQDEALRKKFEVFRHVVFDFNGDYYVAVPLDAPRRVSAEEKNRLLLDAHLLGNLFASFEKEKIFARVINPLLSTRVIQKKLRRQGSHFAGSEAFRVYRFRDGAWSEIILGAIMGASRRARTERRHRLMTEGHRLDTGIADATGDVTTVPASGDMGATDGRVHRDPAQAPGDGDTTLVAAFRGAADAADRAADDEATQDAIRADVRRGVAARGAVATARRAAPQDPLEVDRDHAMRYGPYAAHALRETSAYAEDDDFDAAMDPGEEQADVWDDWDGRETSDDRRRDVDLASRRRRRAEPIGHRLRRELEKRQPLPEAEVHIADADELGSRAQQPEPLRPTANDNVVPLPNRRPPVRSVGPPPSLTQAIRAAQAAEAAQADNQSPSSNADDATRSKTMVPPPPPPTENRTSVTITETTRTVNWDVPTTEATLPPAMQARPVAAKVIVETAPMHPEAAAAAQLNAALTDIWPTESEAPALTDATHERDAVRVIPPPLPVAMGDPIDLAPANVVAEADVADEDLDANADFYDAFAQDEAGDAVTSVHPLDEAELNTLRKFGPTNRGDDDAK